MSARLCIDTRELVRIEHGEDGSAPRLHLVDEAGRTVVLRLPAQAIRALGELAPQAPKPAHVHTVESWRLCPSVDGRAFVLTLHTPEGCAASYLLSTWQMEGIGTLAAQNRLVARPDRLVN